MYDVAFQVLKADYKTVARAGRLMTDHVKLLSLFRKHRITSKFIFFKK